MRIGRVLIASFVGAGALMAFAIATDRLGRDDLQTRSGVQSRPSIPLLGASVDASRLALPRPATPSPVVAQTVAPPSPDPKIVRLGSQPELDVRATTVRRWTITHPRFGEVTVYVPVGTTPREALTVALAERGFQVVG